jgi:hypothetical protein
MTVRKYSSVSIDTTLAAGGISSTATSMTVATGTGTTLMGGITLTAGDIFTVAIDPDTVNEEICYITARSGDVFTIDRAEAGTAGVVHAAGATVRHVLSSDDLNYFNQAIQSTTAPGFTPTISGGSASAVSTQIQIRRDTSTNWTSSNPTLASGEIGVETDTSKFKIGNGSSTWTGLSYPFGDIDGVTAGVGISGGGTSGTVTVTNSMATAIDAKGDLVPGTGADTFARLAVGTNNTVLTADSSTATGLKWAAASGIPTAVASTNITATESTTSTSYTALTTAQSITITTGTKALVIVTTYMDTSSQGGGAMSFAVSGASTIAASDENAVLVLGQSSQTNISGRYSAVTYLTGLTAGSNIFTSQFKAISPFGFTSSFKNRQITVIDMGS